MSRRKMAARREGGPPWPRLPGDYRVRRGALFLTGRLAGFAGAAFLTGFLTGAGFAAGRAATGCFSTGFLEGGVLGFRATGTDSVFAEIACTANTAPCGSMSWVM